MTVCQDLKSCLVILVVGSVALDSIETPYGKKKDILGGSAVHFSTAASLICSSSIVAVVGTDFPKKHIHYLQKKNIDTSGLEISNEGTFRWVGHYLNDLNVAHTDNTILGSFANFQPKLTEDQKKAKFIFLANIDPDIQLKTLAQLNSPNLVAMDSMNLWIDTKPASLKKVIQKVDILFLNEEEAKAITKEKISIKAIHKLHKMGPKLVIIKKGDHGALLYGNKSLFVSNCYPSDKIKDPTGAGDSFAGGVISYLYKIYSNKKIQFDSKVFFEEMKQAVVWGSSIASFNIEEFSTKALDKITISDIRKRCQNIYNISIFNQL